MQGELNLARRRRRRRPPDRSMIHFRRRRSAPEHRSWLHEYRSISTHGWWWWVAYCYVLYWIKSLRPYVSSCTTLWYACVACTSTCVCVRERERNRSCPLLLRSVFVRFWRRPRFVLCSLLLPYDTHIFLFANCVMHACAICMMWLMCVPPWLSMLRSLYICNMRFTNFIRIYFEFTHLNYRAKVSK